MTASRLTVLITLIALALGGVSVLQLESARRSVSTEDVMLGRTPATIYEPSGASDMLVVVSHGFAGSRQMMDAISLTLAREGHSVVAFDYIGHGRHAEALSPEIGNVTGTTEDLVRQTLEVTERSRARTGLNRVALVGHSMATDVIVRAAQRDPSVEAVVAISMYSEAVTSSHPERLLIVSGMFEGRLRDVALETVAQVGRAEEGFTARDGSVSRRAVVAPWVGHVGVLWSTRTLNEVSAWLGRATDAKSTGPWILALLLSITLLFKPIVSVLPKARRQTAQDLRPAIIAASLSAVPASGLAMTGLPLNGLAAFGALALSFGSWGFLVLLLLQADLRLALRDLGGALVMVAWGLGAFALALDRYGAAFVPTGPRAILFLALLPGMLIFGLADRHVVRGRGLLARIGLRVPFLLALVLAMTVHPAELGLTFTVLPVLVLFWAVYGTMARWVEERSGPNGAGLGSGIVLAWAIAASTPLFNA